VGTRHLRRAKRPRQGRRRAQGGWRWALGGAALALVSLCACMVALLCSLADCAHFSGREALIWGVMIAVAGIVLSSLAAGFEILKTALGAPNGWAVLTRHVAARPGVAHPPDGHATASTSTKAPIPFSVAARGGLH